MDQYDGTEAFIDVLNANGVEHIFLNPGGEIQIQDDGEIPPSTDTLP